MLIAIIKFVGICARAVNDFLGKNGPQLAAAVSYYALFSLFPLALAVLSALSFIWGPDSVEDLALRIADQAPVSRKTVSDVLTGIVSSRNIAGLAGTIGLLWAGTAVFGAIRKGINATWGITKPRPFLQERLIDISLMLGAAVLMLISISSTAVLAYLREIMEFITRETHVNGDLLWDRLASLVPPALSFLVFVGLYWFLPNTKVRLKEALPGALAATIAFEVVKNVYVLYVRQYSVYTTVYGSVGSIVALLVWVYVSAIILLFGSLITSRYARYLEAKEQEEEAIRRTVKAGLQPVRPGNGIYVK
ncbi:MAG: YihY/virulence factor BrkB family protein [Chloroflexi bacterium]|nr:YihY/virulence factor BrkB family protein [Chloroflexota bacterium]